jgi:hypothetical protein
MQRTCNALNPSWSDLLAMTVGEIPFQNRVYLCEPQRVTRRQLDYLRWNPRERIDQDARMFLAEHLGASQALADAGRFRGLQVLSPNNSPLAEVMRLSREMAQNPPENFIGRLAGMDIYVDHRIPEGLFVLRTPREEIHSWQADELQRLTPREAARQVLDVLAMWVTGETWPPDRQATITQITAPECEDEVAERAANPADHVRPLCDRARTPDPPKPASRAESFEDFLERSAALIAEHEEKHR